MFTYRECRPEDCGIWTKLNREFMEYEIQDEALWSGAMASCETFQRTFEAAMKQPELICLLLFEENGEPVGFANLMKIFSVWSHGKAMILDDLFIRESCRGKGYGKQALKYIEEYAEKTECRRLQFQSELTNPSAAEFYRGMGYQPAEMYFYVKYFK